MNKHLTNKLLALLLLFCLAACSNDEETPWEEPPAETGHLTRVIAEASFEREELAAMVVDFVAGQGISLPMDFVTLLMCDVNVAAIEYSTTGVDGNPITASGVIAMPQGITSYDHLVSMKCCRSSADMSSSWPIISDMAPARPLTASTRICITN